MSKAKDNGAVEPTKAGSGELPEGWAATHLGRLIAPSKEKIEPSRCPDAPYLSLEHIESGTNRIEAQGMASDIKSTKAVFRSGDVLYGKLRPYLNKVAIPDFDGVCSTDILVFRPSKELLSEYLLRFLSQPAFVQYASDLQKGNSLPRVSFSDLAKYALPLPPLAEQRRIVAKVEALLERANKARECLDRVPSILKHFRQSVLSAACRGRLTADWRDKSDAESGAILLAEILKQRKGRFEANNSTRYRPPMEPRIDREYEHPEDWVVTSVDQVTCLVTSGSRGWAKYYAEDGPLFVRAQNINTDELRLEDAAHVSPPESAEGRRTRIEKNDLLVTITGANVTKSALVREEISEAYVSQHVAIARPVDTRLSAFLFLWVVSPAHGRAKLSDDAYGAGKPGINLDNIRDMPIALPPLAEQVEIVRRVNALMAAADRIEERYLAGAKRTERITQSVLAMAFSGELVETEADLARREGRDYEPASVLLQRIAAGPTAATSSVRLERGRAVLDILLLLEAWNQPVSISALEPALVLMRNDAARQVLLNGRATRRRRRYLSNEPQFVRGLDVIYSGLVANGAIRRVGQTGFELANSRLLSQANAADRAKAAEVIRAIQTLSDLRSLSQVVASIAHEQYEITV